MISANFQNVHTAHLQIFLIRVLSSGLSILFQKLKCHGFWMGNRLSLSVSRQFFLCAVMALEVSSVKYIFEGTFFSFLFFLTFYSNHPGLIMTRALHNPCQVRCFIFKKFIFIYGNYSCFSQLLAKVSNFPFPHSPSFLLSWLFSLLYFILDIKIL